ncbi:hypothetical protein ACJ41O_001871 [Fusarium nematophilum]
MAPLKSFLASLLLLAPFAAAAPVAAPADLTESIQDLVDSIPEELTEDLDKKVGISSFVRTMVANPDAQNIIPNRYIVVYNNTFGEDVITAKEASISLAIKKRNLNKRSSLGHLLSTQINSFKMNKWRAMSLDADDLMVQELFDAEEVAYIEADTHVQLNSAIAQVNAPPGLNRLSHTEPNDSTYIFDDTAGEGITAYVVDTGIRTTHTQFEGRATFGGNFVNNVDDDENGHGSHVAGTIGGATFGVAKKANLVAVKVLDASGGGSNSGVLQGMQFVIDDVEKKGIKGKAVMNMSLGGDLSEAINRAIEALFNAGIVPVVAAGNENRDTALTSPGSAPNAITVGAIDGTNDERAPFSNFGPDVDIYAPGVQVLSVGITSDTATASLSGTSMASPHVAGLAAYLMGFQDVTSPARVTELIKSLAEQSGARVQNNVADTTDLIANNGNQ